MAQPPRLESMKNVFKNEMCHNVKQKKKRESIYTNA